MSIFGDNFGNVEASYGMGLSVVFCLYSDRDFSFDAAKPLYDRQRNQEAAVKRTMQRLKRLAGPKAKLFRDVTLKLPEGERKLDGLLADKSGIYLIRVYGWGTKIFGSLESENWGGGRIIRGRKNSRTRFWN